MGYAEVVLEDGPVGYWRMGAASGSEVDVSGNGNTMTVGGGAPGSVAGLLVGSPDKARSFNGSSDYLSGPTALAAAGGAMTCEAWVNPTAYNAGTDTDILDKWSTGTGQQSWVFRLTGSGLLELYTGIALDSPSAVPLSTTSHVVATHDGTNARLYMNGALVAGPSATTSPRSTSTAAITIGVQATGTGFWNGVIDEVAFYNKALSATRIAAHYIEGSLRGGVVLS